MLLFQSESGIIGDLDTNSNLKDVVELAKEIWTNKTNYENNYKEETCCSEQALELAGVCTTKGRFNECLFPVGGFTSVSQLLSAVYRG